MKQAAERQQLVRDPFDYAVVPMSLPRVTYQQCARNWPPMEKGVVDRWNPSVTVGVKDTGKLHAHWRAMKYWFRSDDFLKWAAYFFRMDYDPEWKVRLEWRVDLPGSLIRPRTQPAPDSQMFFQIFFPWDGVTIPCGTEILSKRNRKPFRRAFTCFRRERLVMCKQGQMFAMRCELDKSWHGTRAILPEQIRRVFEVTIK